MNDRISLKDAIETSAWRMIFAAEPFRNIDVTMTYGDLNAIYEWVHETIPEEYIRKKRCERNGAM